ncbi:hypothetical protein [Escherichia coli IS5]|nr:hypothetical protein [Escherichia coli IS5]
MKTSIQPTGIYTNGENQQTKIKKTSKQLFAAEKFVLRQHNQNNQLNI